MIISGLPQLRKCFLFSLLNFEKGSPKTASGTILLLVKNNHIDSDITWFFESFTIIASNPTAQAKITKSEGSTKISNFFLYLPSKIF